MDIDLLRTFLQVAQCSGFRKAAEKLYLTPSTVSFRIKLLEDRLRVRLFERKKQGAALTLAGRRLLPHAEAMLAAWNRACRELLLPDEAEVLLCLGAPEAIWRLFLSEGLVALRQRWPAWAIRTETAAVERLLTDVLDRLLDLAVTYDAPHLPGLAAEEIGRLRLWLVSSRAGQTLDQALAQDYVQVDWGRDVAAGYGGAAAGLNAAIQGAQPWLALAVLLEAGGAAWLPVPMVGAHIQAGRLFRVEGAPEIELAIQAVWRADAQESARMQAIIAALAPQAD